MFQEYIATYVHTYVYMHVTTSEHLEEVYVQRIMGEIKL